VDLVRELDEDLLDDIAKSRQANPAYALECRQCNRKLRPWRGQSIYVQNGEVDQQLDAMEEVESIEPPSKVKKQILRLYGRACFGCHREDVRLNIDHIYPRSRGRKAAFANLQPLCKKCGSLKGSQRPTEVVVVLSLG